MNEGFYRSLNCFRKDSLLRGGVEKRTAVEYILANKKSVKRMK